MDLRETIRWASFLLFLQTESAICFGKDSSDNRFKVLFYLFCFVLNGTLFLL